MLSKVINEGEREISPPHKRRKIMDFKELCMGFMETAIKKAEKEEVPPTLFYKELGRNTPIGVPYNPRDRGQVKVINTVLRRMDSEGKLEWVINVCEAFMVQRPIEQKDEDLVPSECPDREESLIVMGISRLETCNIMSKIEIKEGGERIIGKATFMNFEVVKNLPVFSGLFSQTIH